MTSSALQKIVLPAVIIIAGFAAEIALSGPLQRSRPQLPEDYGDTDLSMNGSRLKGYALGTEGLLADWYFMRALQYIGDKMLANQNADINMDDLRDLNPRLLYPLLQNATDLDPHFIAAYSYGAVVMPAIDPQKAIDLTNKGIRNNPTSWRLYQHLGYIYWKLKDYEKASESYEKGSQIEGAAPFMKLMAGAMKTEGGSRQTARAVFNQMLAADDEQVRITAQRRLKTLDSLDDRDAIDGVLNEFKEKNGRCASSFAEITAMLMSAKLPENRHFAVDASNHLVDPTGAPYILDKVECRSQLDLDKTGVAAR